MAEELQALRTKLERSSHYLASIIRTPRWHHFRTPCELVSYALLASFSYPVIPRRRTCMPHESAGGTRGAAGAGRNARKAPCSLPIVCCTNECGSTYISCRGMDRAHSMFYFCRRYEAGAHAAAAPWGRRDCADRPQRAPVEALVSLRCAKLRCNDLIRSDLNRSDLFQSDLILSDLILSDLIRSDPIRSCRIRPYPIRSDHLRALRQCARCSLRVRLQCTGARAGSASTRTRRRSSRNGRW